jgi:hypothetical protein
MASSAVHALGFHEGFKNNLNEKIKLPDTCEQPSYELAGEIERQIEQWTL